MLLRTEGILYAAVRCIMYMVSAQLNTDTSAHPEHLLSRWALSNRHIFPNVTGFGWQGSRIW